MSWIREEWITQFEKEKSKKFMLSLQIFGAKHICRQTTLSRERWIIFSTGDKKYQFQLREQSPNKFSVFCAFLCCIEGCKAKWLNWACAASIATLQYYNSCCFVDLSFHHYTLLLSIFSTFKIFCRKVFSKINHANLNAMLYNSLINTDDIPSRPLY